MATFNKAASLLAWIALPIARVVACWRLWTVGRRWSVAALLLLWCWGFAVLWRAGRLRTAAVHGDPHARADFTDHRHALLVLWFVNAAAVAAALWVTR